LEEDVLDLPSPNVAKEAIAETAINVTTAIFLPITLNIVSLGWFIATKIKTKKDIKATVCPEL